MQLILTIDQLKEAIANYVNDQEILSSKFLVQAEHVTINLRTEGKFEEAETVLDNVTINVDAAKKRRG